ncbi:hypothetical protein A3C89_02795 [Candidatus Kaiserbacteria bacterium RIFCSPHIGHO2_02_FULL_50_50]|uniref:Ribulose-phosphate 3-epimerase n=1 Tax=Candidatus Kaiserbacteria bacterium RIFCSPHIGHO2_02_FULL_50_50 TaxID=1798492 RepID=A0A1F6DDA1_9BACT|nr:MAG: hypothetical protein A3C89_02795 [Candidatus Kaiserbacteria bacterium RIFCSPHIGHO2_02_FULL_50_50]OGG89141.1 MAG: hypothetical protein A3G62_00135 [Candidatus Kaiserbacteria bacterium RIFCSPLOWO2_12_FULL_50_10]
MFLSDTVVVDIVPAIIPTSSEDLQGKLSCASAFASDVQIDIVDGVYAKPASWPFAENSLGELAGFQRPALNVELDLMIKNPLEHLDALMALKPTRVVVHIESIDDLDAIIAHSKTHDYILGIGVSLDTPIKYIETLDASDIGYFQIMGIATIGSQGQPFDERVLTKIREVQGCCAEHPVSIDGAVNKETLPRLYTAGASRFVVGSAIWNAENPAAAYEALKTITI